MKKQLIALLTLATSAVATPIDLGPPNSHVVGERNFAWTPPPDISLDGQSVSFDLTFANEQFVRLYETTSHVFLAVPYLVLHGTGTINDPAGVAYSFDGNGERNSILWDFGGGSVTANNETFSFGLGYVYPMMADETGRRRTDVDALDFYGLHFEITMPDSDDFDVVGAGFFMTALGKPWNQVWAIGPHVPDSGSTVVLLGLSVLILGAARKLA